MSSSSELESQTPHFGLRDFLQYFLPGGVVLSAIGVLARVTLEHLASWGNIGFSLLVVLVAYLLGHAVYPLTYPLRWLISRKSHEASATPDFETAYMWVVERHPAFYVSEVFRYRSLARFCIAMVVPTGMLGVAFAFIAWDSSKLNAGISVVVGFLVAIGFAMRYRRYHRTFLRYVLMCRDYAWTKDS